MRARYQLTKKFSRRRPRKGKEIFSLVYTRHAIKDIHKLPREVQHRIKISLDRLRENPFSLATKLVDESLGQYRYRVDDYRVIFDVCDKDIVILRIGHRREIYRK